MMMAEFGGFLSNNLCVGIDVSDVRKMVHVTQNTRPLATKTDSDGQGIEC